MQLKSVKQTSFFTGAIIFALFIALSTLYANAARAETPQAPLDLSLSSFATGFDSPVDITHAGDGRLFVVEQHGVIKIIHSGGSVTTFLDITDRVDPPPPPSSEKGLLGLAFHPNYASNDYFYVNYTNLSGQTSISRFSVTANPDVADPSSELVMLTIGQPYSNHNGGDLNFGPDGYLYIGMGDGGLYDDPGNRAQDPLELLGKMLRIDVDGGGGASDCGGTGSYTIPADNPFVGDPNTCDEIWALGLRNPWRVSFDRVTGDMFIGDVGQNAWEEVDFQLASSVGGENWGWRCYEGNHSYNPSGCGPAGDYDAPIFEYPHSGGCFSITGGYMYRGSQYPWMYGHYLVTDYCTGTFWDLVSDGQGGWTSTQHTNLQTSGYSTFGEGADGELYLANANNGTIYHVEENTTGSPTPTMTATITPTGPTPTPTATATHTPTATEPTSTPTQPTSTPTQPTPTSTQPTSTPTQPTPTSTQPTSTPTPTATTPPGETFDWFFPLILKPADG
ncbi:MAG: PQQ-dependent sugar dehydrogenase [Chloroflexi bacterium]|nr:PQQ-dependent sugar dehydrogenase [Chloroflexota bacterium]